MSNETPVRATADIREFQNALLRFQVATQMGWAEVLKMQAGLLVARLIEWTIPHGMGKDAKAKGKGAVEADIRRVFMDFRSFEFRNESIQKAWDEEDREILDRIFRNSPALSGFKLLDQPESQGSPAEALQRTGAQEYRAGACGDGWAQIRGKQDRRLYPGGPEAGGQSQGRLAGGGPIPGLEVSHLDYEIRRRTAGRGR
jgi:hypothetical protein